MYLLFFGRKVFMEDLSFDERVLIFLKAMKKNSDNLIPRKSLLMFSDGVYMYTFWINNFEDIYEYVNKNIDSFIEYRRCIENINKRYLSLKKNIESFEKRIIEYLEAMKKNNNMLISRKLLLKFENGMMMYSFWEINCERIYMYVMKNFDLLSENYLDCINTIKNEYEKKLAFRLSFEDKIIEYLRAMKVNDNKIISQLSLLMFSDGSKMKRFWDTYKNKDKIYAYVLENEDNLLEYSECISTIKQKYSEVIGGRENVFLSPKVLNRKRGK